MHYTYDDLYRLTGESRTGSHPYQIAFTYDNVGNRLTQNRDGTATSYVYNDRDQLTVETVGAASTNYGYDAAGRMVSKTDASGTTTYGWQDNDRMVSVSGSGVSVAYGYDHEGRRVEETTSAGTKRYLIDGLLPYGQVVAETDVGGNLVAAYVYGLERISQERGGVARTYAADGQGSIRNLTDQDGTVTDSYWYTAFGEELAKVGTTLNPYRYVGEELDANSGFYYNRARWMDPKQGRFVSVDPISGLIHEPLSTHRYLYGDASPLVHADPSGLFPVSIAQVAVISAVSDNVAVYQVVRLKSDIVVPVQKCVRQLDPNPGNPYHEYVRTHWPDWGGHCYMDFGVKDGESRDARGFYPEKTGEDRPGFHWWVVATESLSPSVERMCQTVLVFKNEYKCLDEKLAPGTKGTEYTNPAINNCCTNLNRVMKECRAQ